MLGSSLLQRWLVFRTVSMRYARDQATNEDFGCSAFPRVSCACYGSSFQFWERDPLTDGPSSGPSLPATLGFQYSWVSSRTSYTWLLAVSGYTPSLLSAGAMGRTLSIKKDRPSSRRTLRKVVLLLVFPLIVVIVIVLGIGNCIVDEIVVVQIIVVVVTHCNGTELFALF